MLFVIYLLGVSTGMILQRFIIAMMLRKFPTTICHYCEWERERKEMGKK